MDLTLKQQHEKCLYPEVRVTADKARGSGTVVFCEPTPGEEGMWDTYILTNEHVVDDLIEIKKKWNPILKREVKEDTLGHPVLEVFQYAYTSRVVGGTSYQADIVAYDKEEDIALMRVRSPTEFKFIAELLPEKDINGLVAFLSVWTVGCGLGEKPVITEGRICSFGHDVDNKDYTMVSAASIFGNSGGATFLVGSGQFIGIPSRISVTRVGWAADIVTHMGLIIPVARVYRFLHEQIWDFIIDPKRTSQQCEEDRKRKREMDLLRRIDIEHEPEPAGNVNPRGKYW